MSEYPFGSDGWLSDILSEARKQQEELPEWARHGIDKLISYSKELPEKYRRGAMSDKWQMPSDEEIKSSLLGSPLVVRGILTKWARPVIERRETTIQRQDEMILSLKAHVEGQAARIEKLEAAYKAAVALAAFAHDHDSKCDLRRNGYGGSTWGDTCTCGYDGARARFEIASAVERGDEATEYWWREHSTAAERGEEER